MKFTIEIRAKSEKTQELHQTLQALLPAIRKENGCRDCRVCQDLENGMIFFLTIDWDVRARLEAFMMSESGGALLGAIDLLSETARVRLGNNESWEGTDNLKRMRKKT
jgi:quinol monooxygenase YgiN